MNKFANSTNDFAMKILNQLSKAVLTVVMMLGGVSLTFADSQVTLAVDSQEAFNRWTVIDANLDGSPYQWEYNDDGYALYTQNKSGASEDWLISPALHLEAGKNYRVSFKIRNASTFSSDKQKIKIFIGSMPEVSSMTVELYKNESLQKASWPVEQVCTQIFTPAMSGDYYLACYSYSASYNGNTEFYSFTVDEMVAHPGAVEGLAVEAAGEGALKATLTWTWPSVSDLGGVQTAALTGAKIYRGTTSTFAINDNSLIGVADGGQPGSAATWDDTTVPSPGKYYYKVVPVDDNGESTSTPVAVQSPWIGVDSSLGSISGVTATVDADNEKKVYVNFEAPKGSNGGYVNPVDIHYKITRTSGSGSTVTLEDDYSGAIPYVDESIPGLDTYYYTVYTVYNGSTSWSGAKSNTLTTGGTLSLPYSQNFSSSNSVDLYTFFHGEGATRNWSRSSSALQYWGSPADAWVCTPRFHLETGKAYRLSFTTRVSRASSPKDLYVYCGKEATAEAMQDNQLFYQTIGETISSTKEIYVSVDETGDYCIGFRCYGPSDTYDLYVDDIIFEETVVTPAPVSEITAVAAADGELKVNLQWINPSETNAGTALTSITSVDIYDNSGKIASVAEQMPGEQGLCVITPSAPGVYTYKAVVVSGDAESQPVEITTSWVGYDTPTAPASVNVEVTAAGRVITFEAPTGSVNGGYVDYDALTYTIYRNDEPLADNISAAGYTDSDKLSLGKYTYSVAACNDGYVGEAIKGTPVILGDAYNLLEAPYTPDFTDSEHFELWTQVDEQGAPVDKWKQGKSNGSHYAWFTNANGTWTFTPPFKAWIGEIEVSYKASVWSSRYEEDVDVYLCTSTNPADISTFKLIDNYHVSSVNYPNTVTKTVEIEDHGTYYIGYHVATTNMYLYLAQSDVKQDLSMTTTGIGEVEDDGNGLRLNVADGLITAPDGWRVKVVDVTGMTLADGYGTVDVSSLAPGLYVVAAIDGNGRLHSAKFVKK